MKHYRLAVLGDPVEHSWSPALHEAMLQLAGLEGTYQRVRADRSVLSETVTGLRNGQWHGLNVTMPLKGAAAEMADRLSRDAGRAHSVNTLVFDEENVVGHSTDSTAFRLILANDRFADVGPILLLGAGGSAAAVMAAIDGKRQVFVSARRRESAEALTDSFGGDVVAWGAGIAGSLVVNSTPLGMKGEALPDDVLAAAAGLIDLPYGNAPTPATVAAGKLSIPCADGHEFLILQAIESFRLWTGVQIDYHDLRAALKND